MQLMPKTNKYLKAKISTKKIVKYEDDEKDNYKTNYIKTTKTKTKTRSIIDRNKKKEEKDTFFSNGINPLKYLQKSFQKKQEEKFASESDEEEEEEDEEEEEEIPKKSKIKKNIKVEQIKKIQKPKKISENIESSSDSEDFYENERKYRNKNEDKNYKLMDIRGDDNKIKKKNYMIKKVRYRKNNNIDENSDSEDNSQD